VNILSLFDALLCRTFTHLMGNALRCQSADGFRFNPDFALKKRKKIDPFKSFISQPSGPRKLTLHKGCEMKDLNGPLLKKFHGHYERYI